MRERVKETNEFILGSSAPALSGAEANKGRQGGYLGTTKNDRGRMQTSNE